MLDARIALLCKCPQETQPFLIGTKVLERLTNGESVCQRAVELIQSVEGQTANEDKRYRAFVHHVTQELHCLRLLTFPMTSDLEQQSVGLVHHNHACSHFFEQVKQDSPFDRKGAIGHAAEGMLQGREQGRDQASGGGG